MLSENVSKPISFKSEKEECRHEETENNIQHGKWMKTGIEMPYFILLGRWAYRSTGIFLDIYYPGEICEFVSRKNDQYAQQFLKRNPHLK